MHSRTGHVIVFHLLHHLPVFICRFGPAYSFWMHPFESFNSWIVHNCRYPEATVVETFRLFKFTQFLHITKQIPLGSTFDFWDVSSKDDQSPANIRLHNSRTTLNETYWLISMSICLVRAWRVRKQKTLYRERFFSVGFILTVITTVL